MGYQRARKVFRLTFEDEPGLEVLAYSASLGTITGLLDLVKGLGGDKADRREGLAMLGRVDELFSTFAASLKEWNLEDEDGKPIPATVDGLKTQDLDFTLELILAWMEAVVSVSAPLKQKSSGGDQSPEALIPMEPL